MTVNDKKFLCIRGAASIDKMYRTEGQSWWSKEVLSRDEENNTLDNLDKVNWEVDHVLAHTCPTSAIDGFVDDNSLKFSDPVSKFFEFLVDDSKGKPHPLKFKSWEFGHFHNNRSLDITDNRLEHYQCNYHPIEEML